MYLTIYAMRFHSVEHSSGAQDQCSSIEPSERVDCGFVGITRDECVNRRSCCYSRVPRLGANWCFLPVTSTNPGGTLIYDSVFTLNVVSSLYETGIN